jgi:hypothetical protein
VGGEGDDGGSPALKALRVFEPRVAQLSITGPDIHKDQIVLFRE